MLFKYILRFIIIAVLATIVDNFVDIEIQFQTVTAIFNSIVALGMSAFFIISRRCKREYYRFSNPDVYKLIAYTNMYNFLGAFLNFIFIIPFMIFGLEKFTINGVIIDIPFISWLHLLVILFYYFYFLFELSKFRNGVNSDFPFS
jgi:hypothetical protein